MAQWIECLPSSHKDLLPSTSIADPGHGSTHMKSYHSAGG